MLQITVPSREAWDEVKEEFIWTKEQTLRLEHSLVSISKWEARWHKPFLSDTGRTQEEMIDYVRCMTITQNVDPAVYFFMTDENWEQINKYIGDSRTATTFYEDPHGPKNREVVTSELIYYWMIALNIPFECQTWHLNRLLTLVRICNIKNAPPKKRSKREIMSRNAALNAARRKQLNTTG